MSPVSAGIELLMMFRPSDDDPSRERPFRPCRFTPRPQRVQRFLGGDTFEVCRKRGIIEDFVCVGKTLVRLEEFGLQFLVKFAPFRACGRCPRAERSRYIVKSKAVIADGRARNPARRGNIFRWPLFFPVRTWPWWRKKSNARMLEMHKETKSRVENSS